MRVLVIGATGFIGSRVLAAAVVDPGLTAVIAAVHRAAQAMPSGVEVRRCDVRDPDSLVRLLADVDGVIHCVGGPAPTLESGVANLVRACDRVPSVRRLVHLSSLAIYGEVDRTIDERSAPSAHHWYARVKLSGDLRLARLAAQGREVVLLRPGIVYGPNGRDWSIRIARLLAQQRLGDLGANGDGCCNLVHVDDVAHAAVAALVRPLDEWHGEPGGRDRLDGGRCMTVNLGGHDGYNWNRYLRRFAIALKVGPLADIGPIRLAAEARLAAPILRMAGITLGRLAAGRVRTPDAITPMMVQLFRQDLRVNSSRAALLIGRPFIDAATGLVETADWVRRTNSLDQRDAKVTIR